MQSQTVVEVRLFAQARDILSASKVSVAIGATGTVAELKERIAADHPGLADLLRRSAVAVNRTYAVDDTKITAGDEVALIPPVAGG